MTFASSDMVFYFCPRGYGSPGKDDYLLYMVCVQMGPGYQEQCTARPHTAGVVERSAAMR